MVLEGRLRLALGFGILARVSRVILGEFGHLGLVS